MVSMRRLTLAVAALVAFVTVRAETAVDPTGHWSGAVHAPTADILVAVDIALDDSGTLIGTFSNSSQRLEGFPFWNVALDGRDVTLELKTSDPGIQTLSGRLAEDGRSMSGEFLVGIYAVPFSLERDGDARIAPIPRSPALDDRLTGQWSGALAIGARQLPIVLTLTNDVDGTATGSWAAGEAVATPLRIVSDERSVTLTSTVTPAEFTGALNADGSEIAGRIKQGAIEQPLTFVRASQQTK